ncbi:MAG: hypothetical protein IKV63_05425 [Clostridia bacterium]|nr:hypothetical protein [Clostridia bacterium]
MNRIDPNKVIKGFIAGALVFFILIPIIMIAISYLPNWMIESTLTGSDYFKANVLNEFGLKLIIATFVAPIFTVLVIFVFFKITDIQAEKKAKKDEMKK